jgi:hypothetical protein
VSLLGFDEEVEFSTRKTQETALPRVAPWVMIAFSLLTSHEIDLESRTHTNLATKRHNSTRLSIRPPLLIQVSLLSTLLNIPRTIGWGG